MCDSVSIAFSRALLLDAAVAMIIMFKLAYVNVYGV